MRKVASITAIVVGILMAIAGVVTFVVVSTTLSDQKITVSEDASCASGDGVNGPLSAYCQAKVIDKHTKPSPAGRPTPNSPGMTRTGPWQPTPRSCKRPSLLRWSPSGSRRWRWSWGSSWR